MAIIDVKKNIIQGKIVYYGPGLCGKTTNLEYINRAVPNTQPLMSLSTEGDRTIFFDFLPLDLGQIRGVNTKFKLYTVPGQVRYNLTRKMVLKGADGVVFVADSQEEMMDANIESLSNLFSNLRELRMEPEDIPVVLQYNKRDLPNAAPTEELDKALNTAGYPAFLASAKSGQGVIDTLREISRVVFTKIAADFAGQGGKDTAQKKATKAAATPPPPPPASARTPTSADTKVSAEKKRPAAPQGGGKREASSRTAAVKPETTSIDASVAAEDTVVPDAEAKVETKPAATTASELEQLMALQEKKIAMLLERSIGKMAETIATEVQRRIEENWKKELKTQLAPLSDHGATGGGTGSPEFKDELVRISTHVKNNLPTKKDLDDLRKELAGAVQRVTSELQARTPTAAEKAAPREDTAKLVEQLKSGLPTKKDLDDVRKELTGAVQRVTSELQARTPTAAEKAAPREDTAKLVEQFKSGLPTKKDLDDLRKELTQGMAGIQEQAKVNLSTQGALADLRKDVSRSSESTNSQIAGLQRSFSKAISELRGEVTLLSKATALPTPREMPVSEPNRQATASSDRVTVPAPALLGKLSLQERAGAEDPAAANGPAQPAAEPAEEPAPPEPTPPAPEPAEEAARHAPVEETTRSEPAEEAAPPASPEESAPPHAASPEPEPTEAPAQPVAAPSEDPTATGPQPVADISDDDPRYKNAMRVARVMMSDLGLYYANDVVEGIKSGDIYERLKNQFEEMRKTYDARIPAEIRANRDFLKEAIDLFVEKKRKELGF